MVKKMNEEEKQAIEKFDNLLRKHFEDKKIDVIDYLDYFEGATILNLIDKQQKEIKQLKDELKEERNFNKSALETLKECVHKDKIRKKIDLIDKEYAEFIEKNKNDLYLVNINAQRHSAMQLILEELLGE